MDAMINFESNIVAFGFLEIFLPACQMLMEINWIAQRQVRIFTFYSSDNFKRTQDEKVVISKRIEQLF
jgi:hypothetical protein